MSTADEDVDWYEVLGCNLGSTKEQISKAARKLALIYHPDKNPDPAAAAKFLKVQKAKEFLLDDEKRKEFDDKLRTVTKRKEYDNQRAQNMDSKRKKMREDFESRLKEVNKNETDKTSRNLAFQRQSSVASSNKKAEADMDKFRRDGMERREKASQEAQEKSARKTEFMESRKAMVKEMGLTQIKIKWKRNRQSHSDESLHQLFKAFGHVEEVILTGEKGNAALLTFSSEESARKALEFYATAEDMRVTIVNDGLEKKKSAIFSHVYEKGTGPNVVRGGNKLNADDLLYSIKSKSTENFANSSGLNMDIDMNSVLPEQHGRTEKLDEFLLKERDVLSQVFSSLGIDERDRLISSINSN